MGGGGGGGGGAFTVPSYGEQATNHEGIRMYSARSSYAVETVSCLHLLIEPCISGPGKEMEQEKEKSAN